MLTSEAKLIQNRLNCKIYYQKNKAKMLEQTSIKRGRRSLESRLSKIWFARGLITVCHYKKVGRPVGTLRGRKIREKSTKVPKTIEEKLEYKRQYYIKNREKLLGNITEKRRLQRLAKSLQV